MFKTNKIVIKLIVVCLIVLIMIFSSLARQSKLKTEYKKMYEVSDINEPMIFGAYQIIVEDACIWDSDDYINHLGPSYMSYINWFDFFQDGIKLKTSVVEIKVNVLKLEEDDRNYGLNDFCLILDNAYTGYDPILTEDINKCSSEFDMPVGESKTYIVPYTIVESQMSKEQWENRDKLTYQLVSEVYPVERTINITEITSYINNYEQVVYDDLTSEISTETEYITAVNSDGPDMRYDGQNKIYAKGMEIITAGDFEISLKDIRYIKSIDTMNDVMKEDGYNYLVDYYWRCFDDITGEISESSGQCFVVVTYEIKNISDFEKTYNVLMTRLSNDINEGYSEVIYSSKYNMEGNEHNKLHINVKPEETIEITAIMVLGDYYSYENTVWYFSVDFLGGENTKFFIEWDITKDGGI